MAQSDILDFVKKRNPNEPEFIQAAEEVIASVLPVLDKNPEYKKNTWNDLQKVILHFQRK